MHKNSTKFLHNPQKIPQPGQQNFHSKNQIHISFLFPVVLPSVPISFFLFHAIIYLNYPTASLVIT